MNDGLTPLTPEQQAKQEKQAGKAGFIHRNLIALDMLGNTLSGGKDDETISSRSARDAEQGHVVGKVISKVLTLFQRNHGPKAQAGDVERAEVVEQLEENSPGLEK